MEFSFGDEYKDGPLALGLHKRNSMYDIVPVTECKIIDEDYRKILTCVQDYAIEKELPFQVKPRGVSASSSCKKVSKDRTDSC